MPQMGVSVAEGTVAAWHKQVGDRVAADETICEISTDKIDTDVPAPAADGSRRCWWRRGRRSRSGRSWPGSRRTPCSRRMVGATPTPRRRRPCPPALPLYGVRRSRRTRRGRARGGGLLAGGAADRGRARDRPVGGRGTGRDGRVRKEDVLAAVESGAAGGGPQPAVAAGNAERDVSAPPAQAEPAGGQVREPLSRMRRAIGEHMTRSLRTAAHCTTIIEVDMARVEAARAAVGLSPLPYVAACTVASLGVFGRLNATLEDDVLTRYADVDLGVAVSLGERGLIVPVIRRAQHRSVAGLAMEIRELARRARADELAPDEVRGATFTITNPGRWGTIGATPIINQPQVAILDLEAVVRRPVVVGGDSIAIRPMANLCLSWDHRALDGVMAAEFLADVRARIERWDG